MTWWNAMGEAMERAAAHIDTLPELVVVLLVGALAGWVGFELLVQVTPRKGHGGRP